MKKSLRLQIIVIYTILTVVNLTFVAVMIFENQTDLLISNFTLESDRVAREILKKVESFREHKLEDSSQADEFQSKLLSIGLTNFSVIAAEDNSLEKTRTLFSKWSYSLHFRSQNKTYEYEQRQSGFEHFV